MNSEITWTRYIYIYVCGYVWVCKVTNLFLYLVIWETGRQSDLPSRGSLPNCPQKPRSGQAEAGGQELNTDLESEWQDSHCLSYHLLSPKISLGGKLKAGMELKCKPRHLEMERGHPKWHANHCVKHLRLFDSFKATSLTVWDGWISLYMKLERAIQQILLCTLYSWISVLASYKTSWLTGYQVLHLDPRHLVGGNSASQNYSAKLLHCWVWGAHITRLETPVSSFLHSGPETAFIHWASWQDCTGSKTPRSSFLQFC